MIYEKRNLENIAKLGDHTKAAALKWYKYLKANKLEVLIYETIRSVETQRANVRKGASQTMKSYHIVGQALDFVPILKGQLAWDGYNSAEAKKVIAEAKRLGFTWGGDWKSFIDSPHLQFEHKGYGTDTFGKWKPEEPKRFPYPGLLKEGSRGSHVKLAQAKFGIADDGIFGPKTTAATKAFQKKHGLTADGLIGPKTWKEMFE